MSSEEPKTRKVSLSNYSFQDLLSLGYIYLLLMGIISDAIYYGFMGVNFIAYSSVLDVLLSPIVNMTDSWVLPVVILVSTIVGYFYFKLISKLSARSAKKKGTKDPFENISSRSAAITSAAFVIFFAYLGYAIGSGFKRSQLLEKKNLKPDHELVFANGDTTRARIIGTNTGFVFYAIENDSVLSIAPFQNNVVSIRNLAE